MSWIQPWIDFIWPEIQRKEWFAQSKQMHKSEWHGILGDANCNPSLPGLQDICSPLSSCQGSRFSVRVILGILFWHCYISKEWDGDAVPCLSYHPCPPPERERSPAQSKDGTMIVVVVVKLLASKLPRHNEMTLRLRCFWIKQASQLFLLKRIRPRVA